MKPIFLHILLALIPTSGLFADWKTHGEPSQIQIEGNTSHLSAPVTLTVTDPPKATAARFGPIRVDTSARAINLQAKIESAIPANSKFRLTVLLTHENRFPENMAKQIARTNHTIHSGAKGTLWINVTLPKVNPSGNSCNAFIEIASGDLDRKGAPGPPTTGRVTVGGIELQTSKLSPATTVEQRRASFLQFQGKHTLTGTVGRVSTKSALRLPGLLAAITEVKSTHDPRLTRYLEEHIAIVKGMRDNNLRIGPFEIYFPIANLVAAKQLLGSTLISHPRYPEYVKTVHDFQCSWSDYKSNGDGFPKRPIRDAKSIEDVPESIDTGNFRLLVTAAGYLSAQEFSDFKTTLVNPKNGQKRVLKREEILHEMNLHIRRVYHSIASRNTWEYGSQTYLAIDFAPIHMIAQYSRDPEIRRIAAHTLDCMYSSLAASLNNGHYIHSAGRSKGEFLGTGSGLGFLGWLMFSQDSNRDALTTPFLVYAALPGTYQVPSIIRPSLEFPFVKRERIGSGNNFVCTYTYQSKSFGLTSSIESRNPSSRSNPKWDTDGFYKEAGRHKLNWTSPIPGGFAPQWQNSMQPYAGRRNQPNGNYYGLNPWSQVIQHEGTQIGLADVRDGYPFRQLYTIYHGNGSIRKRVVYSDSAWTICHTGKTMFAFKSLKPATKPGEAWPDKNSITDRFDYKKTAWILEVVEAPNGPDSDAQLEKAMLEFHATLIKARIEATHLDDADKTSPAFTYTSPISGRTLRLDAAIYPIAADGESIPILQYPVLSTHPKQSGSPYIRQSNKELLWLKSDQSIILRRSFGDWLK